MSLLKRAFQAPEDSFFLFGPRGTGKSTLIKSIYKDAIWIDLLLPDVLRQYLAYPERLRQLVEAQPNVSTIVIDEVQKAPSLLDVVHYLIEANPRLQFILTGSSSRKLKQAGVDLLGGRASRKTLFPFMACELGDSFSLDHALQYGLLPLIVNSRNPKEKLKAYIHLYLYAEIKVESLVRNLENFSRFLEVLSFSHANILNISNIARECDVKRKTVENYLVILEDFLLAYRLSPFTKRAQRDICSHPKFYLFDTGIFQMLRPRGFLDRVDEVHGHALEGLVAQHLHAWVQYTQDEYDMYFWRTRTGLEVDFIIYGEKGFFAIEVKSSKKIHSSDLKGLKSFLEDYPMATAILLYRGNEYLKEGNILCVPCEDFLKKLKPNQLVWQAL
jgi:predicted AAA+ superfamily ATPase